MGTTRETRVLSAVGFGLAKAATSLAYMTAMGSVASSIGFVSELDFMIAMNLVACATGLAIAWLAGKGKLAGKSLSQVPAVIIFVAGLSLNFISGPFALPPVFLAKLLGALCGFSITIACACWLEVLSAQDSLQHSINQIVCALIIQGVLVACLSFAPATVVRIAEIAFFLVSSFLLRAVRRNIPATEHKTPPETRPDLRFELFQSYICLFVLVGVVGILHTSVLGSSTEHIVGDVNMWLPLGVATFITAILAFATARRPNPTSVYKGCFPCMLVILSLLPFMGDFLSSFTGFVMIACYDVCGMMFLVFIVERSRTLSYPSYILSGLYLGGSSLSLFVGLSIGLLLGALSADYGLSLLTLLAFATIYPLVTVLMIAVRKSRGSSDRNQSMHIAEAVTMKSVDASEARAEHASELDPAESETSIEQRLAVIAEEVVLTKREREIMAFLARGRSARYIAEALVISENTVWSHIKRVYSKTGVTCKQELIDLVEAPTETSHSS